MRASFLALLALIGAGLAQNNSVSTYYREDDTYKIKYLVVPNENGELYVEDLTIPDDDNSTRVTKRDVSFYLYTNYNSAPYKITSDNLEDLETCSFHASRKNVFIIHGWRNDYTSSVNSLIRKAVLKKESVNVFVVDWSGIASKLYVRAKLAVPKIGKIVAKFIKEVMEAYRVSPSQIYLVGHSLGAHVAGCAGAEIEGVHSIVGLDPAGPLFTFHNTDNRLDSTDAEFVHIIHTNSKRLGFGGSSGHADYYPDGGAVQNSCGLDIFGTCSHSKAYEYYALSITGTQFKATMCDSYDDYLNGRCHGNPTSLMGTLDVDRRASGNYYFTVNDA